MIRRPPRSTRLTHSFPTRRSSDLRPSIVFGPEDQFLNRFAEIIRLAPVVPVIGANTRFQPVYVADVAQAIANAPQNTGLHGGKTSELGGHQTASMLALKPGTAVARRPVRERGG